jgi:hypothetical protein
MNERPSVPARGEALRFRAAAHHSNSSTPQHKDTGTHAHRHTRTHHTTATQHCTTQRWAADAQQHTNMLMNMKG